MSSRGTVRTWVWSLAVLLVTVMVGAKAPAIGEEQTVAATASLVREIQFMLLNVGIDPGPIDGNARQLTNRAAHAFQERRGLPVTDVLNNRPISAAFVERLRKEAAQTLLKGTKPGAEEASTAISPSAAAAGTSKASPAPQPDRFASCTYNPDDFRVGGKQYTPQSFLDEGFDGATARAVANLSQRLEEARQIAGNIGGAALMEVQRQSHVLAYFECRLKVEQASAAKN